MFCFQYVDRVTQEPWRFAPNQAHASDILSLICEMAGLTWRGISEQRTGSGRQRHHAQAIESLEKNAKRDIKRAKLEDLFGEEMFRFHLGSLKRLWGFRAERTFHVVWWDPKHKVYPTEPSN